MSEQIDESGQIRGFTSNKKIKTKKRGFQQKLLDFYYNEFESIIKLTNRGPILSQILIVFGTIQRMTSMFSEKIMDVVVAISQSSSSDDLMVYIRLILSYLKMYPILNSALGFQNEKEIFLFLTTFINSFIFLYVFLRLTFFIYNYNSKQYSNESSFQNNDVQKGSLTLTTSKSKTQQKQSDSQQSKASNQMHSNTQYLFFIFDKLVSIICQIYLHTLLMPSLDISFSFIIGSTYKSSLNQEKKEQFFYVLSLINLVMTCLIGLVLSVNESDYNFYLSDYMAKRDSIANTLLLMQDITFQILYNTQQVIAVIIVHIICLIIRLLYYCSELPYFYDPVSRLYGQITLMHFNFALILILNVSTTINSYANVSFIFVTIIPLSFKAGQVMRQAITKEIILRMQQPIGSRQRKNFLQKANGFQSTINNNQSNSLHSQQYSLNQQYQHLSFFSPNQIDCYVREVFKHFIQIPITQYVDSTLGFYFESIYVSHIKECKIVGCFCDDYKKAHDLTKEDFLSSEKREKFITGYINHIFTMYFYRHKNFYQFDVNRLRFSFLTFLIQVCQIPTKAYVEVISMGRFERNASIREKFVYHSILRKTQNSFSKYFVNSSITNQKLEMIQVIEFDELVEDTTILIFKALNKKYEFYQYLCQDFLNLNVLNKLGQENIKTRNQIEKKVLKIFELNLYNRKAHCLADIYLDHFDLQRRKKKDLLLKSREAINNIRKKIKEINLGIYQIKQKLFQGNTTIVHISLLKPIGVIKRVSHNFKKIFQQDPKDVLGQNVNILMPKAIGLIHNRILESFVEKGDMTTIYKGEALFFGVDKDQYLFPLETRLKLDTYSNSDFGVSASLTALPDNAQYILFDSTTMAIRNTSRNFINKVDQDIRFSPSNFRKGGQFQKIQTFDLSKMVLHLLVFQDDITPIKGKDMFSILIYPRNDKASELIRNDRQSMDFHTYLHLAKDENFFFLFSVFFRQKQFYNAQGITLNYLEIIGLNKMKKRNERLELINAMRHEFEFIFKSEDKAYKNPILIEQLCYSLISSQAQLNQTQSSIENNYNSLTLRSSGAQHSLSSRKSSDFQHPFLNQEDSIEERSQDQRGFDTDTYGTLESSMNKHQILSSPPITLSSFKGRYKEQDKQQNSPKTIPIDLNWNNPLSNKQKQFTLNEIQGDTVSVAGQSFIDTPNSMTNTKRFDIPLPLKAGIQYINSIKGNSLNPQVNVINEGQIAKHLRRKSSEIYYMSQERLNGKEQNLSSLNYNDLNQGNNFSIKALTKEYRKEISPPLSSYSFMKKSSLNDNQKEISNASWISQKETQKNQRVSFEDDCLNLKSSTQRSANQYNFYQPENSPRGCSEDDTGDNQLNSIDNKMRNHIGIGCYQYQNNFQKLKQITFGILILIKQLAFNSEINEQNQRIETDPKKQYLINTYNEFPKIIIEDECKQLDAKDETLPNNKYPATDIFQNEKAIKSKQQFFSTLQGEQNSKHYQLRSQSLSDFVDKKKQINIHQIDKFIDKVEEEKEDERETQQQIESNTKIQKFKPLQKLQTRVSKLIKESYQDKDTNSIHTPQIFLNNTFDLTEFKNQKKNLRQERIQELKRIMINASHQFSTQNTQRQLKSIKKRLDKSRNSQSFQGVDDEDDQPPKGQEMVVDNQSIQSSQSDHQIKKTVFLDMIESKQSPQVIRTIDYFGKISIICMVIVSLLSYGILKSQYESEISLYQDQSNCDNLLSRFVNLITYYNYGKICSARNDWSLIQQQECVNSVQFDIGFQSRLDQVKDVLSNLANTSINKNFQSILLNKKLKMRIENDNYQSSLADLNDKQLIYVFNSMLQYLYNLKRGGDQVKPQQYDRFFYLNIKYFISLLNELSETSFQQVRNVLIDIQSTSRMTLIILILTIFIIISMAIPMFIKIQYSRQEILQLFGTYSFGKLVDTQRQILETIIEILPLYYDFTMNTVIYDKKNLQSDQNSENCNYRNQKDKKLQEINNFRLYLERLLIACEPIDVEQQYISNHKKYTEKYENIIHGDGQNLSQTFTDIQQTDNNFIQTETQQLKQQTIYTQNNDNSSLNLIKNQLNSEQSNIPQVNLTNVGQSTFKKQNQLTDIELTPNLNRESSMLFNPIILTVPPPSSSNKIATQQFNNQQMPETTIRQTYKSPRQSIYQQDSDSINKITPNKAKNEGQRVSLESNSNRFRQIMTPEMSMRSASETSRKRAVIIQQQKKQHTLYHQIITHLNFKKDYCPNQNSENEEKLKYQFFSNTTDNIKKRNISQTSLISKLNFRLILKVTLIFSIISAFPALNYMVSEDFIGQMKNNVNIQELLIRSKFSLLNQLFFQTSKWSFMLLGENQDLLFEYTTEINNLFSISQESVSKLYNSQEIMKDDKQRNYKTIDFNSMDILFYTIQKNACPVLSQVYLSANYTQNLQSCQTVYMNGIFQNGLIVGIQSILTAFSNFIQGDSQATTQQEISELLFRYDQNFNIKALLEVVSISNNIYQQLRDFLIFYTKQYYKDQTELQNILILAYAMITLVIGLTLFWMRFIRKTSQSLIETKNLLSILSIQLLIENRYIYSFLNRQAKNKS